VGLSLAFVFGFVALRIGLPPLAGYLVAGIAVGPFTPGFVADRELAPQLAEIGVILLMFNVGTHFSVRDLWSVRRVALPGAVAQIGAATALGTLLAWTWGWPTSAGVVFGLALSVASTVVLLRALQERNLLEAENGRIAVGWLVVEDLASVVAIVLIPVIAGILTAPEVPAAPAAGSAIFGTVALALGKVAVFVAAMLIVGVPFFPWLIRQVERERSPELFTLATVATAIGVAFGSAELFGVSYALGAFFAGVVINESDISHRASRDMRPLQDAFAALFFIAVGMLFGPHTLVEYPLEIAAVVAIIVLGKSLAAALIVLALRRPLATALTVSAALAQIGEFSFILGTLGTSYALLPPAAFDFIVAGALISIMLNPIVFRVLTGARERT